MFEKMECCFIVGCFSDWTASKKLEWLSQLFLFILNVAFQHYDFSFQYGACLCPDHYHEDEKRCRLNPNIPYLLNQFQAIDFETLETISLKPEIKQDLRQFMDQLYEEYVGIHLKSKKFIDSLADWGQLLKEEKKWKKSHKKTCNLVGNM